MYSYLWCTYSRCASSSHVILSFRVLSSPERLRTRTSNYDTFIGPSLGVGEGQKWSSKRRGPLSFLDFLRSCSPLISESYNLEAMSLRRLFSDRSNGRTDVNLPFRRSFSRARKTAPVGGALLTAAVGA